MGLSRAERLGQDHDHPHAVRPAQRRRRRRHLPGLQLPHPVRRDQARNRLHDPALQFLGRSLDPRESRIRRAPLSVAATPRRGRPHARNVSAWQSARISLPAPCRAAGSSAWRSPPARCIRPSCCCSTSRPRASIPRRGAISGTRSTIWRARASPCWSPPITWTRPNAATASSSSASATSWRAAPWPN